MQGFSKCSHGSVVERRARHLTSCALHRSMCSGFTLVELVAVIVILGIVAIGLGNIIGSATQGYLDANARSELSHVGRFAIERMSRELRSALPGSIAVTNNGSCIAYRPIVAASRYLTLPVPPLPASATFTAVQFTTAGINPAQNYFVAVNALTLQDIANNLSPRAVWPLNGIGAPDGDNRVVITLSASALFPEPSVQQRFYIIGNSVQFCVNPVTNQLTRDGMLLATNILAAQNGNPFSVFSYTPGNLQRNGVITFDIRMARSDGRAINEMIRFSHQVFIRNVP